jgi:hypothetical protein
MKKGGSSPSKADLMKREAIGRFVPEVQRLLRSEVSLSEEVASVVINDHFPDFNLRRHPWGSETGQKRGTGQIPAGQIPSAQLAASMANPCFAHCCHSDQGGSQNHPPVGSPMTAAVP